MNVIAVSGSPRKNGNTARLIERCLDGCLSAGATAERLFLQDLGIMPCRACGACFRTGACIQDDDMATVLQALARSDRIVLASPVFFGTVSAQAKTFIDRLQPLWVRKYRLRDPLFRAEDRRSGLFICTGATRIAKHFEAAEAVAKLAFGVMNVEHRGSVFAMGVDAPGEVEDDHAAMSAAYAAGVDLVSR